MNDLALRRPMRVQSIRPLAGVRVADFSWIGAGSYTTKLLADMGADVIKIETATHPDSLRLSPPYKDGICGINRSGYFADRNSSKRSVALNLKEPAAVDVAMRLIAKSEVVASNFTPGVMEKLGLGYEAVRNVNNAIVYVAMSMQGQRGPESGYLGYGLTIGALTGLQYLTGLPGRDPAGTGTNYPDHIPNPCHAAFAIIAALRHRRRTGQGQLIDIAQTEPMIALLGTEILDWTVNATDRGPRGNARGEGAPQGIYPVRGDDRWIAISATTEPAWRGLLDVLGAPATLCEPRWSLLAERLEASDTLDALIAKITRDLDGDELAAMLQRAGVAAGRVATVVDVMERDPQLAHRRHWVRLWHPEMGETTYNALPVRFAERGVEPRSPAPLLGQHTDEVLADVAGYSPAEIAALRSAGALS